MYKNLEPQKKLFKNKKNYEIIFSIKTKYKFYRHIKDNSFKNIKITK